MVPVMHDYEMTYIVTPTVADDGVIATNEKVASTITSAGGEIVDIHPWGGKRRLAYPIEQHRDGYYVTTKFRTSAAAAHGLNAQIRLNENIIRHVVFRSDEL